MVCFFIRSSYILTRMNVVAYFVVNKYCSTYLQVNVSSYLWHTESVNILRKKVVKQNEQDVICLKMYVTLKIAFALLLL